jgi:alpha-glucoside transport system permease protein
MSTIPAGPAAATATITEEAIEAPRPPLSRRVKQRLTSRGATAAAIIIATLWTVPTFGLLISSFRPEDRIQDSGWWTFLGDFQFTLENYADVLASGRSSSPNLG